MWQFDLEPRFLFILSRRFLPWRDSRVPKYSEVVPVVLARSGLRMNGQGDLQDERKEQEASIDCTATVYG